MEASRDGSTSSGASSPEPEAETYTQEHPQTQKRKGGRKPVSALSVTAQHNMSKSSLTKRRKIYATSEERKQRNRQAQAAFRERRTEYIKQLETTIKHHEDALQNLQQSHRSAADECLMLRYKNSLLERILLEKGKPTFPNLLSRVMALILY
jgi:predicted NodU family carbamoyl transferase